MAQRPRHALTTLSAFAILAMLTLAGCYNGQQASTTVQSQMNSGNGAQERIGAIRVENATLVLGPEGSRSATLIMSVFNDGAADDVLQGGEVAGAPTQPQAPVMIPAGGSVTFGYGDEYWANVCGVDLTVSTYVPLSLRFEAASRLRTEVLVVPPTGYYEGIAPNPAC